MTAPKIPATKVVKSATKTAGVDSRSLAAPMPTEDSVTAQPIAYSRAFDGLVQGGDDIVGLLAYALYKQSVRESAINGLETSKSARNLPQATVDAFRSSAEQLITQIITSSIAQASPDIEKSAIVSQLDTHHADMISAIVREREITEKYITSRTNFWAALGTNILAWLISILIAALVLYLAQQPSLEEVASNAALSKGSKIEKSTNLVNGK